MKNPVGTICVCLGALLGILGLFLPFVSADVMGVSFSTNVFTPICIVWIVFAVLALVFTFVGGGLGKILTLVFSILAGGGFLFSFFVNNGDISSLDGAAGGIASDIVSKGIGYWLLLIGGIVIILAGIISLFTAKKTDDTPIQ